MDEEINNIPEQIQESNVEQITKEPAAPLKIKDPKRVEAGKKLAEYNRKAKKQQKQNIKPQEDKSEFIIIMDTRHKYYISGCNYWIRIHSV